MRWIWRSGWQSQISRGNKAERGIKGWTLSQTERQERKVTKSEELFERAGKLVPGGVNSPVRAFRSVGRTPFFVEKAKGAYLYDADGNRYLDYVCSWGPGILGHAVPSVVEAVQKACENGLTFGAPTEKRWSLHS